MPLLRMMLAICIVAVGPLTQDVSGQTSPAFDAASVRPSNRDSPQHTNIPLDSGNVYTTADPRARSSAGGLFIATHQPLWRYISFAYKLPGTQELALRFSIFSGAPKSGAPSWVTGSFDSQPEYFDISARAPADASIDTLRLMMQTLLANRFRLVTHSVTADTPVFALVLAKAGAAGPKLQLHPSSDACASPAAEQTPEESPHTASAIGDLPPVCGVIARVASSIPGQHYGGRAVPLSLLATSISTMTGLAVTPRPVVDQTGLSGLYDFTLTWMHDASGDAAITDNGANFRETLKVQLGLELKSSHAPNQFLIVDHVNRPDEN